MAINKMIRLGEVREMRVVTPLKRSLEVDREEDGLGSPAKIICAPGNPFMRRLQDYSQDRQEPAS